MDDSFLELVAQMGDWIDGVETYIKAQITPGLIVYGLSAVVGAVSAITAVALCRALSLRKSQ